MKNQFHHKYRQRIVFILISIILGSIIQVLIIQEPQVIAANDLNKNLPKKTVIATPNPTATPGLHLLWQYSTVVALNPEPCGPQDTGLVFFGSDTISVRQGDALSYGCIKGVGNPTVKTVPSGHRFLYAGSLHPGNGIFDPPPEWVRDLIHLHVDFTQQAQDACALLPRHEISDDIKDISGTISPGNYPTIVVSDTLTMLPGLYCLAGDFIVYEGASVTGDGITIYMTDGDFLPQYNSNVQIKAPPGGILPDPVWSDLLIYVANFHSAEITLPGTPLSFYWGVIFAPASNITINAIHDAFFFTQLIGWNVSLGGASGVNVEVDFWP